MVNGRQDQGEATHHQAPGGLCSTQTRGDIRS